MESSNRKSPEDPELRELLDTVEMLRRELESGKPWYQSRALIGAVVGLVAGAIAVIAEFLGYHVSIDTEGVTTLVFGLISLGALLVSIYGSVKRTQRITFKPPSAGRTPRGVAGEQ